MNRQSNSAHPLEDELIEKAKEESKLWKDPHCFMGGVGYGMGIQAEIERNRSKPEYAPFQKCPKCNGQGTVSKPSYVPGDVSQWSSSATSFVCDVCNGAKIIPMHMIKVEQPKQEP